MKQALHYIRKILLYILVILMGLYIIMQIILSHAFVRGEDAHINKYFGKFSCEKDDDCENKKNFDYCTNINYNGRIKLISWKDYETNPEVGCQCILRHCMKK